MKGSNKRADRGLIFLVGIAAMTLGCVDDLDSLLKSSDNSPGPRCSSSDDGKTWHLGTGRIEDIKRQSPDFFARGNGRWRREGLTGGIKGVTEIKPAIMEGAEAFEFITKEAPYRVRAIRFDRMIAILATPGQCPQVAAIDRCVDRRLKTEIQVEGTAPCLGPLTVPKDHVTVTIGNNEMLKEKLVFGEPFMVASDGVSVSFSIYLEGNKEPAARIERTVNDFTKALPEEVLVLLRYGEEVPAGTLYRNVPSNLQTASMTEKTVRARVAGATKAASAATTPREINDLIKRHPKGVLPGDEETIGVIAARTRMLLDQQVQAEPSPENLWSIGLFVRLHEALAGEKPDVAAVESKYGPLLNRPGFNEPKIQGAFMVLLPESKYTKALEAEEAKEAQLAEVGASKQAATASTEEAWLEVQGRADEIATLAYKIKFGQQNFAQSRHNQRGLASMQKYRDGLVRDAFCPAKRAFVKAAGASEYSRRAAEHCSNEAPTDVGVGGVEKPLKVECKAAFATGC